MPILTRAQAKSVGGLDIIKGKGVVTGKAAMALRRALENPKIDPEKIRRFKEALEFHRGVKIIP